MSSGATPTRWFGDEVAGPLEPEPRQAGQDAALVGDRRRQDDVERAEPVGRDEEQAVVADRVQVADLAGAEEGVGERASG